MSDTDNTGGPAFPGPAMGETTSGRILNYEGMTLRDWFAGQIINGLCADPTNHKLFDDEFDAAKNAYIIADAMIAARLKGGDA
jgi:hypothetical protein